MSRLLSLVAVCVLPSVSLAQYPDLSGKWSGYWVSDTNGHHGPLHAKFKQLDCDTYKVTYRGRFAVVIPFRYTTTMDVVGTGAGVAILAAEKPLGPFGTFRTTATATGTTFDATFTSRRDSGRFVLRR
ncbi:MAG: hypothetical protein J0I06_13345 [Planctomycetes bacterium]|nr:hypothetical protein [Planctomycetota bacterium]